jgi:acetolactate decarboxylase
MKKRVLFISLIISLVLGITSCSKAPYDTITQLSTIDAILAGAYDGQMTLKEIISFGDFGIGTFHRLDGEMLILDKKVYQIKMDGKVYTPPATLTTPYAAVSRFKPDMTIKLPKGLDFEGLERLINKNVSNKNIFCGVKVRGRFSKMKTRSVPAQDKPYPPLTEITKHQAVFDMINVSGTIVGFRTPPYVKGIGVPGYHIHFISDDFKSGGHILSFTLDHGSAEIDLCNRFLMILPEGDTDFSRMDLERDRSADLDQAEK